MDLAVLSGTAKMIQNQTNGVYTRGPRKLDPDINGMGGEIAVCKYFNRFPDLTIGPHFSGYDLKIKGKRVDVKTTTYSPGYLQAKNTKKMDACDIFILVHAEFPRFEIIGGVTAADLIHDGNLKDTGFGTCYTLEESQLQPIELLFA
jgi:hypothetical protein